jgi:integrase
LEILNLNFPEVSIVGYGKSIEIFKQVGNPKDVVKKFKLADFTGTHGIGHTRMATESAITTDAVIFSAYTGLRQSAILQIKPKHVNLDKNIITIGGKDFKTKGLESRIIPLHPLAKKVLLNRLGKSLLFGGDYTNKDQMYNLFKKVKAYNGFDNDYVWHSLRHSFGTWLGEKTNPRQIMSLMGHKDVTTSMRYCHISDEALHNSISLI